MTVYRMSTSTSSTKKIKGSYSLVDTQTKALAQTIKEMQKKEKRRQRWMDCAKSDARRHELEERYVEERDRDVDLLNRLVNDLRTVKTKTIEGQYDRLHKHRVENRKNTYNKLSMEVNKFAGVDSSEGYVYQKGRIEKMKKQDHYAQMKMNKKSIDIYEEKRKLNLLKEKKNILTQMVALTTADYYNRLADNSSVMSTQSGESWATFASKRSNVSGRSGGSGRILMNSRHSKVPPLNFEKLSNKSR